VTVDLSPQDGVSCYIKDCVMGNYLTDTQMHLIKNGTVTESCFPYTSKNGSIEECIDQCKDETEEYKKYYAQNMYTTEGTAINKNTFLDIVTLIIDELITNGPLSAGFTIYEDFYSLENKSILVTGGAGFVGSNLVKELIKSYNCKVTVVLVFVGSY
jgi:hypothetical protein